jgi:lactoylglutathione lyase
MAKMRHIAIIVKNADETATFFENAFGMHRAGTARRGLYVSDGTINIALLEQERDDEPLGLAHFGMWCDDLDEAQAQAEAAGARYLTGRPSSPLSFYEAKFKSPEGFVFDITHNGWAGAMKDVVPAKAKETAE